MTWRTSKQLFFDSFRRNAIGSLALAALATAACTVPLAQKFKNDVRHLAGDELMGRKAGTAESDLAALWIAGRFASFGLEPAGDNGSFLQAFALPNARRVKPAAAITGTDLDRFLIASPASPLGDVAGTLTDVGTGSDYHDELWKDSTPRIALARVPEAAERASDNPHSFGSPVRMLAFTAKQKGARGLVCVVKDAAAVTPDTGEDTDAGLPFIYATEGGLPALLKATKAAEMFRFSTAIETVPRKTNNVVALIPAAKPDAEIVVVGAHYDHLGYGGSDSLAPGVRAIHYGADDNASGTSMMLRLAEHFAPMSGRLNRHLLFAAWGAEEMGLLGSKYWTVHPTKPMEKVVAKINFDMVGRSKDRKLTIAGTGSALEFDGLLQRINDGLANPLSLTVTKTLSNLGGSSDHRSFLVKKKPSIFFFTGIHGDYHKPTDTMEKIEYATMVEIAGFARSVIQQIVDLPKITWADLPIDSTPAASQPTGAETGLRAWFGSVPDYGADDGGVVLSGTSPASPAEKAGLKAGDTVTKIGEFKIDNINDLTIALSKLKPGMKVEVQYKRKGQQEKVMVTIEARPTATRR